MASPNLNLPHITENQNNKETTANLQTDGLDHAINSIQQIPIVGDGSDPGDALLTEAQFRSYSLFRLTGTPTGVFQLAIPNGITRQFCVNNETAFDCLVEYDGGTGGVTVAAGEYRILHSLDNGPEVYINSVSAGGGGISDVIQDLSPQLGGSLDVNGQDIVSASNGNIRLIPDGTGNIVLGTITVDADQAIGAAQNGYALIYNHGTGLFSAQALPAATQIPVFDDGTEVVENLTGIDFTGSGVTVTEDSGTGIIVDVPGAAAPAPIPVEDEGIEVSADVTGFNFTGAGVQVIEDSGGSVEVQIPGGGGGTAISVQDEGVEITPAATSLNFTGAGVTVTEDSGDGVEIQIGTSTATATHTDLSITNPDAETNSITGWTGAGTVTPAAAAVGGYTAYENTGGEFGSYIFDGPTGSDGELYQDIDVSGYAATALYYQSGATIVQDDSGTNDQVEYRVELRDSGGAVLYEDFKLLGDETAERQTRADPYFLIPALDGGVTLRLRIIFTKGSAGTKVNAMCDNVTARVVEITGGLDVYVEDEGARVTDNVAGFNFTGAGVEVIEDSGDGVEVQVRGRTKTEVFLSTDGDFTEVGISLPENAEFKIFIHDLSPTVDANDVFLTFFLDGSEVVTGYDFHQELLSMTSGSVRQDYNDNTLAIPMGDGRTSAAWGLESSVSDFAAVITVHHPNHDGDRVVECKCQYQGTTGARISGQTYGTLPGSGAITGFKIAADSDEWDDGRVFYQID